MAYGIWMMEYGIWMMAYGIWMMAYGIWICSLHTRRICAAELWSLDALQRVLLRCTAYGHSLARWVQQHVNSLVRWVQQLTCIALRAQGFPSHSRRGRSCAKHAARPRMPPLKSSPAAPIRRCVCVCVCSMPPPEPPELVARRPVQVTACARSGARLRVRGEETFEDSETGVP